MTSANFFTLRVLISSENSLVEKIMFIQENQKRGIIVLRMARKRLVPTAVGPKKAVKYFWRTLSGFFLASPKLYTVPEKKDFLLF
jgi:hypothetical protein